MCEVRVHPVTRRLARNFDGLFPEHNLLNEPHVVVTLALQTQHRQSAMSNEMLTERQECFQRLVERMQAFKSYVDGKERWCDFIDPSTGAPFHTDSATTLIECDERYRSIGFEILELGCCRALCNERFGQCLVMTSAFVQGSQEDVAGGLGLLEPTEASATAAAAGYSVSEPAPKKPRSVENNCGFAVPTSLDARASLSNGIEMPYVGLGTYLQSHDEAEASVRHALRCGYRHIDTAEHYANHEGIAKAIASAGLPRSQLFITDKLNPGGIFGQPGKSYEATMASLKKHLDILQTSYVDLYLIHHPGAKNERLEQWRALCDAQKEGLVKAIGVSNYSVKHIEEIRAAGMKLPEFNQVEIHPLCTQTDLVAYLRANHIQPIAYSSLAPCAGWRVEKGQASAKSDAHTRQVHLLDSLASKYKVSQAQVLLRWALQKGYFILPKSSQPARVETNCQLFHFDIDDDDMSRLDALDENSALAWPIGNPLEWE